MEENSTREVVLPEINPSLPSNPSTPTITYLKLEIYDYITSISINSDYRILSKTYAIITYKFNNQNDF